MRLAPLVALLALTAACAPEDVASPGKDRPGSDPVAEPDEVADAPLDDLALLAACASDLGVVAQTWSADLEAQPSALSWSHGRLAVADDSGAVRLFAQRTPGVLESVALPETAAAVRALTWDGPADSLLGGDATGRVTLWDRDGEVLGAMGLGNDPVRAVALSGDGLYAAAASDRDGTPVHLWSLDGGLRLEVPTAIEQVAALGLLADGRLLVAGAQAGAPALEVRSGEELSATWTGPSGFSLRGMAVADRDEVVLVADDGDAGLLAVILPNGKARAVWSLGAHRPLSAAMLPNGELVATVGADETLRVWDPRSGGEVLRVDVPGAVAVALDPVTQTLATVGSDGALRLFACRD